MIDMKSRTACFTGHRELPADDLPAISKHLKDTHSSSTIPRLFNDYDGAERHNPRKKTRNPATELLCSGVRLCAETAEKPYFKRFSGIEKVHRNSIKNYGGLMAEDEGFEPPQTESESGVLPLHKSSISQSEHSCAPTHDLLYPLFSKCQALFSNLRKFFHVAPERP